MSTPTNEEERAVRREVLAPQQAEALAGLMDIDVPGGGLLPPLWHWVYLLERRPHRDLGPDGHATFGIPAPPRPGQRRMFAGGRVQTRRQLVLGRPAVRVTWVASTREKSGRTGPLTFVTVRNEISQDGEVAVVDEQDIVYRTPDSTLAPTAEPADEMEVCGPRLVMDVDSPLLFRFSALTYNAHRIHYDREYCQQEGYHDLLVHGPLQALMMGELFRRNGVSLVGAEYTYRLVVPMVGLQRMTASAGDGGIGQATETRSEQGVLTAMGHLGVLS